MFVAFSTVGLCFNLLYRVVYFVLFSLFSFFFFFPFFFQCACLESQYVMYLRRCVFFLFVCFSKSLCSLRETFFNTFGIAWTFQELREADTSFCLPVKGVSSLKGNSLLKKIIEYAKRRRSWQKHTVPRDRERGAVGGPYLSSPIRQTDRLADLSLKLHIFY